MTTATAKRLRIEAAARETTKSLDTLRAERDAAWTRVCRVASTRWDLTKFEAADDLYQARCDLLDAEYVPTS